MSPRYFYDQQLTTRVDHLKLDRELGALDGEIATTKVGIDRARSAQSEARGREREETLRFRRAALEEYSGTEQSIARSREQLQKVRAHLIETGKGLVSNLLAHLKTFLKCLKVWEVWLVLMPL